MTMTVRRRKDVRTPRVFMHKIADVRGGISVQTSELGGDYIREGAVVSAPIDGICHLIKIAVLTEEATEGATTLNVQKGHNFKTGDVVMAKVGGKASAITAIDTTTSKKYDVITVEATLGEAISADGYLIEAAEATTEDTAALKYTPFAVVGTGKNIFPNTNFDTDAWLIGVTKGNNLPDCVAEYLKGIINY